MRRFLISLLFALIVCAAPTAGAEDFKAGERKVLTVDGIEYAFRWCPPGEFMMGSPEGEPGRNDEKNDEKLHQVKLTKGFWMLETEVTQEMWESVMGENPSEFKGPWKPVEKVNWEECQSFCRKLSGKLGQKVQIPTEAQWEYACRAGTTGVFAGDLDSMAWYKKNSKEMTHTVGQKEPNAWGLHDMHGNVWEMCADWYSSSYYEVSPMTDPENSTRPTFPSSLPETEKGSITVSCASPPRVCRGGAWNLRDGDCRSAKRGGFYRGSRNSSLGLRVILVPNQESNARR